MQLDISQVFQAAKCYEGGEGEQKAALQNVTDSWENLRLRADPCFSFTCGSVGCCNKTVASGLSQSADLMQDNLFVCFFV